jgi:N-acetylmuramic acid 6-phosphate etherase
VLNLITSGIMLRLGRVYRGMMVNMQATNARLERRAEAMVAQIARCNQAQATCALDQADGDIKISGASGVGLRQGGSENYSRKI